MSPLDPNYSVDGVSFQKPLGTLAEAMAQRIHKEALSIPAAPSYVWVDMFVMLRQALYTYSLLFYLASDDRRERDTFLRNEYSMIASQIVRSLIDILYNITFILEDPRAHGELFRKSGFKKLYKNLAEDKQRYGGEPAWDSYLTEQSAHADAGMLE